MNYGRDGILRRRSQLNSRSRKRINRLGLIISNLLIIFIIGAAVLVACVVIGGFRGIIDTAPDITNINVTPTGFSTFVYDTQGNQTAKLVSTDANRIPVTLDMVPLEMQHAFVAIEDERFYEHHGIDIQGIIRAGFRGVQSILAGGSPNEGASTITQQLLKNNVFVGWTDETFSESVRRKIQEQYLAVELEKSMSKDDILLNYLNTINLGHNTLGVQAAALRYFGKPVSQLNVSECACIASIAQNPTGFDPIVYPENNNKRRLTVLEHMYEQGWITEEEYKQAVNDNVYDRIQLVDQETDDNAIDSYFVDALTQQVMNDLKAKGYNETQAFTLLYSGGLNIYSTQDPEIQKICDEEVANPDNYPSGAKWYLTYSLSTQSADGTVTNYSTQMLESYFRESNAAFTLNFPSQDDAYAAIEQYKAAVMAEGDKVIGEKIDLEPQPQISLTIEDQSTGNIVAMVGGRGEKKANRTLNRAYDVMRQPGSTFKIVSTYAPALDAAGMSLATTFDDAPYTYEDGTPVRNWYGESYRGISTIRQGIQSSLNIVTVKCLTAITPQLGYEYLLDFGFTTLVDGQEINGKVFSDARQPLALGGITYGVKNYELNAAYATIANGGEYLEPKLYSKVTDHDGNVILDANDRKTRRVLKETTAWLLTSAMEDVVTKGTGTAVNFGTTAIAGKTGTTEKYGDVWFAGYTNYYTCTTWAGFDDGITKLGSGQTGQAQTIWRAVMSRVHDGLPRKEFEQPAGIEKLTVCRLSGLLPVHGLCDGSLTSEFYAMDTAPTETCDVHYQGLICAYSGLPATDFCPFKVTGVSTYSSSGLRCPHTQEFMTQENIQEIIAVQQAEMNEKAAAAQAAAEAAGAKASAQAGLEAANATLMEADALLRAAQDQLIAAQQNGDEAGIAAWTQAVNQATDNYNMAIQQQAAAMAAVEAAQAAETAGPETQLQAPGDA